MVTRKRKTVTKPEKKARTAKAAAPSDERKSRIVAVSNLAQEVIDEIDGLKTNLTRDPGAANVQASDLDALHDKVAELKASIDALVA